MKINKTVLGAAFGAASLMMAGSHVLAAEGNITPTQKTR